ncbi:putative enzyme related to lactoylglutathione lyase [Labedella gwakjiensis]|uniref:Putative enzyme related to lactoylglutathione lyase n=1 Tax=Labedella gwakjiensis TaxID=390269 RepID=A0A2P8GSP1_9MICO|nr:VOC family protein [Labedella gwakjiensis]PSL36986.1 putative enzyme related to lactoylglutathione lyase [Labedella gwakjiensis]RUQ81854.1 VOC family protein [Labedella gwakjiensis]
MFKTTPAFSGFSVDDIPAARAFYADVLGLDVREENGMLFLQIHQGQPILVYPKGDAHRPASFTILNFPVDNVEAAVRELADRGVEFERYGGVDDLGIMRAGGPLIAWFTDPAGNILSVIESSDA